MTQITETTIKTTRDGRLVVYRESSIYVGGSHHTIAHEPTPLTRQEQAKVGAEYTHRVGAVVLTDGEAKLLRTAITEDQRALAAERNRPENVERGRIASVYAQAAKLEDEDYSRSLYLISAADAALATWRQQYPAAAREEHRMQLQDKAEHERSLAVGALTYDADGSLSHEDQQRRHDEHMTAAAALDAQAAAL